MAWKWFWNTETKYYDDEINRNTDWGGDESTNNQPVSGGRVLEWLKNEINGKFGVIRVSEEMDIRNYYSLEMFATKEDERLYDSDNETYADLLTRVTIPISAVQGDTYVSMLGANVPLLDIEVKGDVFNVPLNFRAVRITSYGNINMNERGTLVVDVSIDNGETFHTVATLNNVLSSRDYTDDKAYENVNIGGYLAQGKQLVRVRAYFKYEDEATGDIKTVTSSWISIGNSVTKKTEMSLQLETNYFTPMFAKNEETGEYNRFVVNYRVMGAITKRLYVTVNGSVASTTIMKELSAEVDGKTEGISLGYDSNYGFHTHGVHEVVAHLEYTDGLGNIIKSLELRNQFMVVNPESDNYDPTKKYLLLQNVKEEAVNYILSEIAEYAVYSPDKSDTELTFKITNAKDETYTEVSKSVIANTSNVIEMTVEIEPEDEGNIPEGYKTRFYVYKNDENFISSSGLNEFGYYDLYIDNSEAVVPVLGSTFLMNPKNRDNSETNPKRILNERANNAEIDSTWENFEFVNDGWVLDSDGNKVLRVMAGSKLIINRNVFKQFMSTPDSAMTIDIDYKVSNVTDVDNPIISINGGSGKGLILNALKGWVKTASYNDNDNCMFAWRENKRLFLSLNIHNNIRPFGKECVYPNDKASQAQNSMALARVLLNGDLVREIPFDKTSTSEWCTDENTAIVIGNEGADIDIYSIRVYENTQVDVKDLLNRNWISSLPTTLEKQKAKNYNNLLEGGRITLEKALQRGLNCIVYHGDRPYAFNTAEPSGWIEYFRYDQNGNFMPEYSGKNCETSKGLKWKAQGSTAKTYYEHNVQDDNSKVKATIEVPLDKFHESIKVRVEGSKAYITGGNLGKNFPLEAEEEEYTYSNGMVTVPDGWFDGNGKYRGMGYCVTPNTSLAQKKVAKINYASAMQSHLTAACNSYDDLHYLVCGASPLQQQYIDKGLARPVSAKRTEPFLMFWEIDGVIYYTGLCIYGAGKMDKVSWGYAKKKHPMFAMIEGADNNLPLTDFRVPFDDDVIYNVDEEGWAYNGEQSFDFDAGATDDNDIPKTEIVNKWKEYHNFVYLNSSNIDFYDGTIDDFRLSEQATKNLTTKYWCTEGSKAFHLIRYDHINKNWVDAGLKGIDGNYSIIDLKTDIRTKTTYEKYKNSSAYATINNAFKGDFGKFFKNNAKFLMSLDSLLFCYSYVLALLAGTDNSSKNTYFKIDPIKQDLSAQANEEFSLWWETNFGVQFNYTECYLVYMDGDDMDSILPVNNKGNLTKPYYIERLYPYSDEAPTVCLYEGMQNQLFNLVELIYSDEERSSMMNRILTAAQSLVSNDDKLLNLNDGKVSVWGFLHKYFFNVQYYFPQICYIEQARIRYEFAELMGHTGARSVRPISQSIGSLVENEQLFMTQRLVYMTSFAVFGALGNGAGSIGLSDTTDQFAFQGSPLPDGNPALFVFHVKPHQYIYPCAFNGQTTRPSYQRTSPNLTCALLVAENVAQVSDTSMGIRGINYYSEMGELKDKSITTPVNITGKRLKALSASESEEQIFRPSSVRITAPNVSLLTLHLPMDELDMTQLIRLKEVSLGGIKKLMFPKSGVLTSVFLKGDVAEIVLDGQPNLVTLDVANKAAIHKLVLNTPKLATQALAESIYTAQQANVVLQNVSISGVDWTNFDVATLEWYADRGASFNGLIRIYEPNANTPSVTWIIKNKFLKAFGNVDDATSDDYRGLLLEYQKVDFDASAAIIIGNFFVDDLIVADKGYNEVEEFIFSVKPYFQYENTQTKIVFSVEGGGNYTMDADGTFKVRMYELSKVELTAIIKADVSVIKNGASVVESFSKEIEIWLRPALLGDVVYYDGTYGDPYKYDGSKTPIGICFFVAPKNSDGSNPDLYFNKDDKHRRLMVALKYVNINGSSLNPFGCMPYWGNGESSLVVLNEDGSYLSLSIPEAGLTTTTFYDIPNPNFGFGIPTSNGSTTTISDESIRDNSNECVMYNNGFRLFSPNTFVGTGFSYNESVLDVQKRTLTKEYANLCGSGYREGDIVNIALIYTLNIIKHRNTILSHGIEMVGMPSFNIPSKKYDVPTLAQFEQLLLEIQQWGTDVYKDSNPKKWIQVAYPAISAAYEYEPNVAFNEILNDKFTSHNWFIPVGGFLGRFGWYNNTENESNIFYPAVSLGLISSTVFNSCVSPQESNINGCAYLYINKFDSSTKSASFNTLPICAF